MKAAVIAFVSYYVFFLLLRNVRERNGRHASYTRASVPPPVEKSDIVYKGNEQAITTEEMHDILSRRQHYYSSLHPDWQEVFLKRLKSFMEKKIFIVKDDEIFREMPVLVSSSAIQLTFGLKDYHLHFYKYIRIHPQEYFAHNSFKLLAGNVSNNTITVAWNHFLHGYELRTDGSNLGLHEMSHALYFQKVVIDGNYARKFCKNYDCLLTECHPASQLERSGLKNLYSEYADTDLQEFWAESVELFFEKPAELQNHYPAVYDWLKKLLNQDPLNAQFPILVSTPSVDQKLKRFFGQY